MVSEKDYEKLVRAVGDNYYDMWSFQEDGIYEVWLNERLDKVDAVIRYDDFKDAYENSGIADDLHFRYFESTDRGLEEMSKDVGVSVEVLKELGFMEEE